MKNSLFPHSPTWRKLFSFHFPNVEKTTKNKFIPLNHEIKINMKKTLPLFALGLFFTTGCNKPLINDQVKNDFQERKEVMKCDYAQQALNLAENSASQEALSFLYAYMSWPDVADYTPEYHVTQTECALRAREEMPWGKQIPNREWLHFVLPVRVNNEHLDTFRTTYYETLKKRVEGLSMKDAVLEVNHWCHEYVTYKPSDARTSTPLQSMKTGYGRCGEESTFTVAALRTIGIPARQVYTPRWAHTDDNHAWVEAWVDGQWYFLGACEPEPVLNLAWFNQPASRAILMHTRAFGKYDGPEDQMSRTASFTEINVTENYADVKTTEVVVVDTNGNPVPNADIAFKVYNYAELYTVTQTKTDTEGKACITSGQGDLVAWAAYEGTFGFQKFSVGKDTNVKVVLSRREGETFTEELNIVPPVGKNNVPEVSPESRRENTRRFALEDSIRTAYIATFPDSAQVALFCQKENLSFHPLFGFIQKSRGNYQNVFDLYRKYPQQATPLLQQLSEKDLRDFEMEVVEDHLQFASREQEGRYWKYILCPRIANEHLTPWRSYFKAAFPKKEQQQFKENPMLLAEWIKENVTTDSIWNPLQLCLSPETAHHFRYADLRSKGLLFVAAARSMGIPARINPVTGKVQYTTDLSQKELSWTNVSLDESSSKKLVAEGHFSLTYTPREYMENPKYYTHFTLSQLQEGMPKLQEYDEQHNWKNRFENGVDTEAGNYVLTSGTRMADGSVLERLSFFPVTADKEVETSLVMREDKEQVAVIGNFNSENRYFDIQANKVKSILSTTGRGYFVVGLIRANHEPTNHILHDIEKLSKELENWGRTILMVFPTQDEYDRFNKNRTEFTHLPKNLCFGVDTEGQIAKDLFNHGLTHHKELPIVIIGDTFNRVVFKTQGYTIGLGEQLKQTIAKL